MEYASHIQIMQPRVSTKKVWNQVHHKIQRYYDKINVTTSLYSFLYQPQIPKLYWTKSEGGREVSFDGMPFSVDKVSLLDCQYGEHYWKEKKEKENKKKRLKLQGSRKIGCHAHIRTHTYTLYPDFQLSPDESHGVS